MRYFPPDIKRLTLHRHVSNPGNNQFKMVGNLLLLLVACGSNLASTHIVTSVHSDLVFLKCVNTLTDLMQRSLCPMYGQGEQYPMEGIPHPALDPLEFESRSWEFRNIMKRCCSRPCTISELLDVC